MMTSDYIMKVFPAVIEEVAVAESLKDSFY
jgi:hypothetical protein